MIAPSEPTAFAQSAKLIWNPSPDTNVIGYEIYYGSASRTYTSTLVLGNVTNTIVFGLVAGNTYYFAATCYDAAGNESGFSDEASYAVPLTVTNTVPPNQPPTLNPIASLILNENAGVQTVALTGITSGATNQNQPLTITAVSSNTRLVKPSINYTNPNTTAILTFKPAHNTYGVATIAVTAKNNNQSNNFVTRTFTVTVLSRSQALAASTSPGSVATSSVPTLTPESSVMGQFSFVASGIAGNTLVVEASTDLMNWIPVQTNTMQTNLTSFIFMDTNAVAFPQRFYRSYSLP